MKLPYRFYFFSLIVFHLVYGMVFLGVLSAVPQYVYVWNVLVQVALCVFLMYRYHPFRTQYTFEPLDAKLIFGSAMLLLVNVVSLPVLYNHLRTRLDPLMQDMRDIDILRL